jgi:hypothetical protein
MIVTTALRLNYKFSILADYPEASAYVSNIITSNNSEADQECFVNQVTSWYSREVCWCYL